MIELFALSFLTRQVVLIVVCVLLGLVVLGFGVLLFLKIQAVRKENAVESLPTLIDLGLEEQEEQQFSRSSPAEDDDSISAFFEEDDDEDEAMQERFLG